VRSASATCGCCISIVIALPPSLHFASLDQPGIGLLVEIIALVHQRPDISTGLLLEHFADRNEAPALTRLATAGAVETTAATPLDARVLDDADRRQQAFLDAIARLDAQALQARIEALQARMATLVDAEKQELRELLSLRLLQRH
jgi:DNA primase